MRMPLVLLAVPTALLGVLAFMPSVVSAMLDPGEASAADPEGMTIHLGTAAISLVLAGLGGFAALVEWVRLDRRDPAASLGTLRPVLAGGFGVDGIYDAVVVRPLVGASRLVVAGDRDVVHAYVRGAGRAARTLGALPHAAQVGRVQAYVTAVMAFVVVLALAGAGASLW
jgi:NADH-quinone oxidoreductase subunit L